MSSVTSADVEALLVAMFRGQNVQATNQFLLQFVDLAEAWEIAMALFESRYSYVKYFAANIIYTKVRKHWGQLNESSRQSLFVFLRDQLATNLRHDTSASNELRPFLNRICLGLAAVCCRAPGAVLGYAEYAMSLMGNIDRQEERWALEMLSVLPEEVATIDASRSLKVELEGQLMSLLPRLLGLIDNLTLALASRPSLTVDLAAILRAAIVVLNAWMKFGLTITELAREHPATLELLLFALRCDDRLCVVECSNMISELFLVTEFPRPAARTEIINTLLAQLNLCVPHLRKYFTNLVHDDQNEEVAVAVCGAFVAVVVQEIELFMAIPASQAAKDFMAFVLFCACQRPRKLATASLEVWVSIADTAVEQRDVYSNQALLSYFNASIELLMYPNGFRSWEQVSCDVEDEEDFNNYRNVRESSLDEVFTACIYSLGMEFFAVLNSKIQPVITNPESFDWRPLECVCFILQLVGSAVKTSFMGNSAVIDYIGQLIQYLLSLPVECIIQHPELEESVVNMLRAYTFLIAFSTSPMNVHFPKAVEYLFRCILQSNVSTATAAGQALMQYFAYGQHVLLIKGDIRSDGQPTMLPSPLLQGCIDVVSKSIVDPVRSMTHRSAYLSLLHAHCQVLTYASAERATEQTSLLGAGIIQSLQTVSNSSQSVWQPAQITSMLNLSACLIRNSNRIDCAYNQATVFCATFYGLLQGLGTLLMGPQYDSVLAALCECFSTILQSFAIDYLPQAPEVSTFVVRCLSCRLACSAALGTAKTVIEVLSGHMSTEGVQIFLSHHWREVTSSLLRTNSNSDWTGDPQIMEAFFLFVISFAVALPDQFAVNSDLPVICQLMLLCLQNAHDKASVKAVLALVQNIFCSNVTDETARSNLLAVGCSMGQVLVNEILLCLDGKVTSLMRPTLIDALYAIMMGCLSGNRELECRRWVEQCVAVSEGGGYAWPNIGAASKPALINAMFYFAGNDKRKFKALLLDTSKISLGEQTEDCLSSYFDPMG